MVIYPFLLVLINAQSLRIYDGHIVVQIDIQYLVEYTNPVVEHLALKGNLSNSSLLICFLLRNNHSFHIIKTFNAKWGWQLRSADQLFTRTLIHSIYMRRRPTHFYFILFYLFFNKKEVNISYYLHGGAHFCYCSKKYEGMQISLSNALLTELIQFYNPTY